jgi:mannose/cellobiose epimerase-like protein (N-acyl-D-glucosamine 2-epimerase family)
MCTLDDSGIPIDDEKYIWYQGRGIWIYSYLHNRFGRESRWLDTAQRARDFMVKKMYAGKGRWLERVHRDGSPLAPAGKSLYDRLFAAEGLIEFYKATGNKEDLDLAIESIRTAAEIYDRPDFKPGGNRPAGTRIQGHTMMFVLVLRQLLEVRNEPWSEQMLRKHVDAAVNLFHNPQLNICNEYLDFNYGRTEPADQMSLGHTVETRWMTMFEALRRGDRALFRQAGDALKDWIPMGWDFNMDGFGGGNYYALDTDDHLHGAAFDDKTMWSHAEIMIACATYLEYSGEPWAADWLGRAYDYIRKVFAHESRPWSLNATRDGKIVSKANHPTDRMDNYHPPRCMIHCIESLDRMIENKGGVTPFPKGAGA